MNLIAKLGIIYATACHASLYTTALDWVSVVSCHCRHTALTTIIIQTRRGEGELASHLQQQLALWVCVKCYTGCH